MDIGMEGIIMAMVRNISIVTGIQGEIFSIPIDIRNGGIIVAAIITMMVLIFSLTFVNIFGRA